MVGQGSVQVEAPWSCVAETDKWEKTRTVYRQIGWACPPHSAKQRPEWGSEGPAGAREVSDCSARRSEATVDRKLGRDSQMENKKEVLKWSESPSSREGLTFS